MTLISRRSAFSGLALIGTGTLLLAGCSAAPENNGNSKGPAVSDFLPCMVSDTGGFDDNSFNEIGKAGLDEAAKSLGVKEKAVESRAETDYASNISGLVDQGCDLIVTVGFLLSPATVQGAKANPDVKFAIIDDFADNSGAKDKDGKDIGDGKTDAPNIKPIVFDTAQAAFLAGYAAASYSKTGAVGTFGGLPIPPVTIFMDGFVDGVNYYNQAKGKSVKVFGWDVASQKGAFTGGFDANDTAKGTAKNIIDQGVDVILPVGGPIYKSAVEAIKDSGKDIAMIGVDADVTQTDPSIANILLTSIMKGMQVGVSEVVKSAAANKFDATPFVGTLKNGGVSIAPFHEFESKVDPGLKGELDKIKADIISGKIKVESPSSPKS